MLDAPQAEHIASTCFPATVIRLFPLITVLLQEYLEVAYGTAQSLKLFC